jgi:hypothetical protein
MKILPGVAAVLLIGLGIGTAAAQPPNPYAAVPPPRVEVIPAPPGGRFVWEPGHWHWNGRTYLWAGGRYIRRGPHFHNFVEGHWAWAPRIGRYVWRPAHWQ